MNNTTGVESGSRSVRRACDKCSRLKEKCIRSTENVSCTRCKRLDLVCQTLRPIRKVGRKPHPDGPTSSRMAKKSSKTAPRKEAIHPIPPIPQEDVICSTLLQSDPNLLP